MAALGSCLGKLTMSQEITEIRELVKQLGQEITHLHKLVDGYNSAPKTIADIANQPRTCRDYSQVEVPAPQPPKAAKLLATNSDASIRMYKMPDKGYAIYYQLLVIRELTLTAICIEFANCMHHSIASNRPTPTSKQKELTDDNRS